MVSVRVEVGDREEDQRSVSSTNAVQAIVCCCRVMGESR